LGLKIEHTIANFKAGFKLLKIFGATFTTILGFSYDFTRSSGISRFVAFHSFKKIIYKKALVDKCIVK